MQKNLKIQSNFIKINYTKDIFKKKLKITILLINLKQINIPVNRQRIIFQGKLLNNSENLSTYKV